MGKSAALVRAPLPAAWTLEQARSLEARDVMGGRRRKDAEKQEFRDRKPGLWALAERCQWMGWKRCMLWELVGRGT
jgi:hypothetical protein